MRNSLITVTLGMALCMASCGETGFKSQTECWSQPIDPLQPRIHTAVDCPENAEIFLIIGQSNGTNWAYDFSQSVGEVYVRYEGQCYPAKDPLPGGNGGRGSPWPVFGDLRSQNTGRPVMLITRGLGGTSVRQWQSCDYIEQAKLEAVDIEVDHVFWIQGESDHDIETPEDYAASLKVVDERLREEIGEKPTMWVSQTSLLFGVPSQTVRDGQRLFCESTANARCGPDTDVIKDRYDNLHFGPQGARDMAILWAQALEN